MNKELAGHAKMCVRMKLRKDERDLRNRAENMTLAQQANVHKRIERGYTTIAWLKRVEVKAARDDWNCRECGEEHSPSSPCP